jgi:hypothetical protein
MLKNLEAVKALAKDLRKDAPRDPADELGGFAGAARCIDKCRASLLGWQGDYLYGCPMDQKFLSSAGIGANEFKAFIATGATDQDAARWIEEHSQKSADTA